MSINWDQLRSRLDELNQLLIDSSSFDHKKREELQKEHAQLQNLLTKQDTINSLNKALAECQEQRAAISDQEMIDLFTLEEEDLTAQLKEVQGELDDLLYPPDPLDNRSVFVEIRAGAGGQEAALFAGDLLKMYTNYATKKGWRASLVDLSETDLGGIKEAVLEIEGKKVYGHLKRESGVHRVQRVPKTETQGRVHTSTVTVAILPEAEEVDVNINPADLRIDTYRAGGAGGQHVNKTDSAVRITHIPTGIVVACQDERSQHKNRAKAMKVLQSRILQAERERQEAQLTQQRREMVGTGMRAEKIRTYNYPQNRITDHQIDVTLKKLDFMMLGDLDDLIQPLMEFDRAQRKAQAVI